MWRFHCGRFICLRVLCPCADQCGQFLWAQSKSRSLDVHLPDDILLFFIAIGGGVLLLLLLLIFLIACAVKACRWLKRERFERRLASMGRGVGMLFMVCMVGWVVSIGVYLYRVKNHLLPLSLGFFFSGLALSVATTWLFLKAFSPPSLGVLVPIREAESSEAELMTDGFRKAFRQFFKEFCQRMIHIPSMDPPLRLITISAIAQVATSALLLWVYHKPVSPVDVSPFEEQHWQMDWRVFGICVFSMIIAWSFVLTGASRGRKGLLLVLALFTIATRPAHFQIRVLVTWICLMGVIWFWGIQRWWSNRLPFPDTDASFDWRAAANRLAFLGGSLGLYYLILWLWLPGTGPGSFHALITGQVFNFSLFLIPVLFLAGTDLAELSELIAHGFAAGFARPRLLMFVMTGLFAGAMFFLSLRSLQHRDFLSYSEGTNEWIGLIVASVILAAAWYWFVHAPRFRASGGVLIRFFSVEVMGVVILLLLCSFVVVLLLLYQHYSGYVCIAVFAALFVSPRVLFRSLPVPEQPHSRHPPFAALVLAAVFLTGAHEIATLFEAQFRQPPEASETIHFSVHNQGEYSLAYPGKWLLLPSEKWPRPPSGDGTDTAFHHAASMEPFWKGGFIVSREYSGFRSDAATSAVVALWRVSVDAEDWFEVPFSDQNGRQAGQEFAMRISETRERVHAWVWLRYAGHNTWMLAGFCPEQYQQFYRVLFQQMADSWRPDGSAAAPGPLRATYANTALRIITFGLLPLALLPAGLALLYLSRRRPYDGKVCRLLRRCFVDPSPDLLPVRVGELESADPRRSAGLFVVLVALTAFFFLPVGYLTEFFGVLDFPQNPFSPLKLFIAASTLMTVILLATPRTARTSNLFPQLLQLNLGMLFLSLWYKFYSAAGHLSEKSLKLQAVLFLMLLIWDLLMSGKEITNGDGRIFRRANRVLLYVGYLVLVSSAIMYQTCQTGGSNGAPEGEKFFDAENTIQEGILWLGSPLLLTGFIVRIRK